MNSILLTSFNQWIAWALADLAGLPDLPRQHFPISRRIRLEAAVASLRHALGRANELRCSARIALCMRTLSRIRAELRTLPA